jgi:putative transposase
MNFRPVPSRQFLNALVGLSFNDRYEDMERNISFVPISRDDVGYLFQAVNDTEQKLFLAHREICVALESGKAAIKYGGNRVARQAS